MKIKHTNTELCCKASFKLHTFDSKKTVFHDTFF